ncbi:MAG: hypothetical protein WBC44_06365 [Planctomycetaceae bacterium]
MAATGWVYVVPYRSDAESALKALRQDVFSRGQYTLPRDTLTGQSDQATAAAMPSAATMRKLLDISKAVNEVMKEFGADTRSAEKDSQNLEKFIRTVEKKGPAHAARKALGGKQKSALKSIDEAHRVAGESGTHSILDIERTATEPGFGLATPLSAAELHLIFGTEKPERTAVREKERDGTLAGLRDRWQAAYFAVYDGETPTELVFCGNSGD